ncbi:MAG: lysophospholipid acyltransferase family protein [Spirochaetes bacterium]|nr:lysophospholipid acyltransferase family protein [Spirochaetota bacterium]
MAYRRGHRMVTFLPSFLPFTIVFRLVLFAVRIVNWSLFSIEIRGRHNLRGIGPAILVSNHSLVVDPALIAHAIRPRRTYFTMLEETALIPLLGTFVRLLGGIPLVRGSGAGGRLERGIDDALRHLGLVHYFPEGECYLRNQQIKPFHRGAFHAACLRGLPVLVVLGEPLVPDRDVPLRAAEESLARRIREQMQAVIDREGGCKTMSRGAMPRLTLHRQGARGTAD